MDFKNYKSTAAAVNQKQTQLQSIVNNPTMATFNMSFAQQNLNMDSQAYLQSPNSQMPQISSSQNDLHRDGNNVFSVERSNRQPS